MKAHQLALRTLTLASLFGLSHPQAATFKRFWRGYQRSDLTSQEFAERINGKIIPATRDLFTKASGLVSYQPVLTNTLATSSSSLVAQEYALLEYESEPSYRQFRSTPEGTAYGDLHWEMFDKTQSKSAVVEAYLGTLESAHAYDLLGRDVDALRSTSHFALYTKRAGVSVIDFMNGIKSFVDERRVNAPRFGLQSAFILVMEDHVVLYENWAQPSSRATYARAVAGANFTPGEFVIRRTSNLPMDAELRSTTQALRPGQGTKLVK